MLVLSRKSGESIVVPGCDVTITVVRVRGNRVQLGISAPSDVAVHRDEVWRQRMARPCDQTEFRPDPPGSTC